MMSFENAVRRPATATGAGSGTLTGHLAAVAPAALDR